MGKDIRARAKALKRDKKITKILKFALLLLVLVLIIVYFAVSFMYNNGNFSISLDRNLYYKNKVIIYDDPEYKVFRSELYAKTVDYFDNISYKWLPSDLDGNYYGSHNGDNYIAYTFYVENTGDDTVDYYSEIIIDEVFKNLDDAIRIRVYRNGEQTTYAKLGKNGNPEANTTPFQSDSLVEQKHVKGLKPNEIHKYTIVVWLEGSDPECTDNILGGEIKMHMQFLSELVEK